tara:strand:+ start:1211 stop:3745 length:2535 start_codon:yes stop_codon:yes gene_type:complete
MPKSILDIKAFHGGLNNSADPRDVTDIELAEAVNIDVSSVGKITMLGGTTDAHDANQHHSAPNNTGWVGFDGIGLFSWSSDYNFLNNSGTHASGYEAKQSRCNLIALYDTQDEEASIHLYQKTYEPASMTSRWATSASKIDLGGDTAKPSFYVVDGNLRISDYSNEDGNISKFFGIVTPKEYGNDNSELGYHGGCDRTGYSDYHSVVSGNSELKGCFPEPGPNADGDLVAINAITGNVFANTYAHSPTGNLLQPVYAFANEALDSGLTAEADASATNSGMYWGVGLESGQGANDSGTWMTNTETRYKFYITTVYDDGTQESLPQLMRMYHSGMYADNTYLIQEGAVSEIYFTNAQTWDEVGQDVAAYFMPVVKLVGGGTSGGLQNSYNFGAPNASDTHSGNKRISGCRIYWAENEDGYSDLWRLFDIDFHKGVKSYGMEGSTGGDGYADWVSFAHAEAEIKNYLKPNWENNQVSNKFKHPPRLLSYYAHNTHEHTDAISLNSFRSAVYVNGIVYAGNYNQTIDGKAIQFSDRIIRSVPFQPDKFPQGNVIQTAVNDGDEIIALAAYSDRLLQFNKNVLYIHNISQGDPYLEATLKFKGVLHEGSVCTTDTGIAWANNEGAYFYNGNQVIDLIERDGQKVIDPATWKSFWSTQNNATNTTGYFPRGKQIIFNAYGYVYVYNMTTQSWSRGTQGTIEYANGVSNFINDYNGDLVYYDYEGENLKTWDITPKGSDAMNITTKDMDFGSPHLRKRVYKVYITYKGSTTVEGETTDFPTVTYGVNGNTPDSSTTPVTAMSDNAEWSRAEYKMGSDANSCYSFQLKIAGAADATFEINDISVIYRVKTIK